MFAIMSSGFGSRMVQKARWTFLNPFADPCSTHFAMFRISRRRGLSRSSARWYGRTEPASVSVPSPRRGEGGAKRRMRGVAQLRTGDFRALSWFQSPRGAITPPSRRRPATEVSPGREAGGTRSARRSEPAKAGGRDQPRARDFCGSNGGRVLNLPELFAARPVRRARASGPFRLSASNCLSALLPTVR